MKYFRIWPLEIGRLNATTTVRWGLCELQWPTGLEAAMTVKEQERYRELGSTARKREWLAARLGLKRLLIENELIDSYQSCQVVKDRYGAPSAVLDRRPDRRAMNCSLTHKKGRAGFCVGWSSATKVGIDMELVDERPWRLRHAFATYKDSLAERLEYASRYAVLWACKESASKALGKGMLLDFRSLVVTGAEDREFTVLADGTVALAGRYDFVDDLAVAVVMSEP